MAGDTSTLSLVSTLTTALESAKSAIPLDSTQTSEGISLLDVKNDLLLAYLQNLAFLLVMRLRHDSNGEDIRNDVVKKLVELRVYLERGVRPLESKLKYQIDKVVHAADDAERRAAAVASKGSTAAKSKKSSTQQNGEESDSQDSDSEASDAEDADTIIPTEAAPARPRMAGFLKNAPSALAKDNTNGKSHDSSTTATGAYKPPRINPTTMPEPSSTRDRDQGLARKRRSQLLDEYIDEELSTTPLAQPSIGSSGTITQQGRGAMSARERQRDTERKEYEERNFTRLPAMSKAERKKEKLKSQKDSRDMFGGEDWTGLGGLGDRIHRTVASGNGQGGGKGVFERRDKRKRETVDGPRGDGVGIGETFEKRRKVLQQRAEKKSRRKG